MSRYKKEQMVIMFKSKDRCGKDTVSEIALDFILCNTPFTADIFTNARDLKKVVANLLKISVEELDKFKNEAKYKLDIGIDNTNKISIRDFIINTSKAISRNLGRATLIDKLVKSIFKSELDIIIIPDARFEIEYKKLKSKFKTFVIEIESDLKECGKNGNVYELDKIPTDYTVTNVEGKLEIVKKEVEDLLSSIISEMEIKD